MTCSFRSELQAEGSSNSKTNDHGSMKFPKANTQLGNPESDNLVTKSAKCASALADKCKTLALLSSYLGPAGQLCIWCQKNQMGACHIDQLVLTKLHLGNIH